MKKYLALAALAFAILITPVLAQQPTVAQLQALIAQLMAQLSALQGGGSGSGNVWCHNFNQNLKIETSGAETQALHTALEKSGFGSFGSTFGNDSEMVGRAKFNFTEETAAAVVGFQEKYRDEVLVPNNLARGTGYVGPSTRAKLNQLYGCARRPIPIVVVPPVVLPDGGCAGGAMFDFITGGRCPTGNLPPVISGISGPTTLNVGQTGTWTVSASDPENGTLSYSVIWGDEPVYSLANNTPSLSPAIQQSTTFTHRYSDARVYYPRFTVSNTSGQSAQTSIGVNVGGQTQPCPINYIWNSAGCVPPVTPASTITVLSPNGGEAFGVGTPTTISWSGGPFSSGISVSLAAPDASLTNNPFIGWIGNTIRGASSLQWDGKTICQGFNGPGAGVGCSTVSPGRYKMFVTVFTGNGNEAANDFSGSYFTITPAVVAVQHPPIGITSPTYNSQFIMGIDRLPVVASVGSTKPGSLRLILTQPVHGTSNPIDLGYFTLNSGTVPTNAVNLVLGPANPAMYPQTPGTYQITGDWNSNDGTEQTLNASSTLFKVVATTTPSVTSQATLNQMASALNAIQAAINGLKSR